MSSPHESRGVFRPPFRHSHEGSPELIRFNALFPETKTVQSFRTFDDRIGCDKGVDHFYKYHATVTLSRTPHIFLDKNMERAQKAYRNYKNANKAFREASAQLRKIGFMSELKYFPNIGPKQAQSMNIKYQKAHQNMINAYKRRNNAHTLLRKLAYNFGIIGGNVNQVKNLLNQIMYAPPNRPGGFGGIGYEMTALRSRKKPNRTKSASPRRRSPLKRAHSARF